jgi:hypothetical protein
MSVSSYSLARNPRSLSVIAILSATFLLTGELFSCCRINEAFAREVARLFQSMGRAGIEKPAAAQADDSDHHAHCHGHQAQPLAQAQATSAPVTDGTVFHPEGTCISEHSVARQSMVGSESFTWSPFPASTAFRFVPAPVPTLSVERPRLQNKSSPPLFLLTLRILV